MSAVKVLFIQNSWNDIKSLEHELRRGGLNPVWKRVDNKKDLRASLAAGEWDVILSDFELPDFNAAEALGALNEADADVPFIIVSNPVEMEQAVALMRSGARDVVTRENLGKLAATVKRELRERDFRRQCRKTDDLLRHQASYDALTNLPNRTLFFDRLSQALKRAKRERILLAILFVDLDGFKLVNDTFGHTVGDELLKQAAERLGHCIRESDTIGRLGGDEFAIILVDTVRARSAEMVAKKVLDSLSEPFPLNESEAYISASVGISLYPNHGDDAVTLIRNADAAMYQAKNLGRNKYKSFSTDEEAPPTAAEEGEHIGRRAIDRAAFGPPGTQPAWSTKSRGHAPPVSPIRPWVWPAVAAIGFAASILGWVLASNLTSRLPLSGDDTVATEDKAKELPNFAPASGPEPIANDSNRGK